MSKTAPEPGSPTLRARAPILLLGAAVTVNLILVLYTAVATLQRFPNAGDEYACLLSGEMFSKGRLSIPSPAHPRFFDFNHVLNDGKYYGKYPPGWPFLLMIGTVLGAPWILNPLLGAGTLGLLWLLCRRHFGDRVASFVAILLMLNPFFIFNSASYFSHTSCLFFLTLCLYGALNWMEHPESLREAGWVGLGAGMAFLIRPFTVVLMLAPIAMFMIGTAVRQRNDRRVWISLAVSAAAPLLAVALYCLYNYRQTGNPFLQPFTKYEPTDHPQLPMSLAQWWGWFAKNAGARLLELNWPWFPFSLVAVGVFWIVPDLRANRKGRLLFFSAAMLSAGYSFYAADGGIGYGPRYSFESLLGMVPLMALVYARFHKIATYVLAVTLAIHCTVFVTYTRMTARVIQEKRGVFEAVRKAGIQDAIVFLRSGTGVTHPGDLNRNGLRFDGSVLYVLDRGRENVELCRSFPARKAYLYVLDAGPEPQPLQPLDILR